MNTYVIAARKCRGKSMLTRAETYVVFMLDKTISQGN